MEEMKNLNVEGLATESVEEIVTKVTLKDKVVAYGLTGLCITGVGCIGYLGYKGTVKVMNNVRKKKHEVDTEDGAVVDVDINVDEEPED